MDIPGTLSAIATALSVAKELRDIDNQFDKAELKLKVADLSEALADARLGVLDADEAARSKDREIAELKESMRFRADETISVDGYRYRKNEKGEPAGHPYCSSCASDDRWIETITSNDPGRPIKCPRCKATFGYLTSYSG